MSKAAMLDRSNGSGKPMSQMGQKVLEAIRAAFLPTDVWNNDDDVIAKETLRKWEDVLASSDLALYGVWSVECILMRAGRRYRISRNMWDLADDLDVGIPTILHPKTIECLDNGANGMDCYVYLPDMTGDYERFCHEGMQALANVYKISKWMQNRADGIYGTDKEWTNKALSAIIETMTLIQKEFEACEADCS